MPCNGKLTSSVVPQVLSASIGYSFWKLPIETTLQESPRNLAQRPRSDTRQLSASILYLKTSKDIGWADFTTQRFLSS